VDLVRQVIRVILLLWAGSAFSLAQREVIDTQPLETPQQVKNLLQQKDLEPYAVINDLEKKLFLARKEDEKQSLYRELGLYLYENKQIEKAVSYLQEVEHQYRDGLINLVLAEFYCFHQVNIDKAYHYFHSIKDTRDLAPQFHSLYQLLRKNLLFQKISQEEVPIQDPNISEIFYYQEDLWIGTWNGGLLRFSLNTNTATTIQPPKMSLESLAIRKIIPYKDYIYIGQYTGLSVYNKRNSSFTKINLPLEIQKIQDIWIQQNTLYISTLEEGIWTLQEGRTKKLESPDHHFTVFTQWKNKLYVGTVQNGLWIVENNRVSPSSVPLPYRTNISALSTWNDALLIGTFGDGFYSYSNDIMTHFDHLNSPLGDNWILDILPLDDKVVLGTFGGGFSLYTEKDKSIETYNAERGFTGVDVSALTRVGDTIIIGTLGSGIYLIQEDKL